MKKSLEITLTTIHLGSIKRVVTLGIDGKDLANDYLLKLGKGNLAGVSSIMKRLKMISEHESLENKITYRHVGEQVFEVKTKTGLRFYTFHDEIEGFGNQLIIATSGGKKGQKKEQGSDITKAKQLKKDYFKAKSLSSTQFNLIPLKNES